MNYTNSVTFLLDNSCPSIVYRTRKEILEESLSTPHMLQLQKQIQNAPDVQKILALQKEDGWLGGSFHGEDGPEYGIRYLREKGLDSEHPVIQRALAALKGLQEDLGGLGRVGEYLDDYRVGGIKMMKACVFAYAGYEEEDFIQEQIEEALQAFKYVANLAAIEDIYILHKDKVLVFAPEVIWPSIYHLRLLAFTKSWRNPDNLETLSVAFNKLVRFSPIPSIKLLHKSQVISPASLYMNDFNPSMSQIKAKEWMMWFHRTEMIARLGIINKVKPIESQVQYLEDMLSKNEGLFTETLSHYYFNKWTQYIGLALEDNWRVKDARIRDLTFRSLLILKLANKLEL